LPCRGGDTEAEVNAQFNGFIYSTQPVKVYRLQQLPGEITCRFDPVQKTEASSQPNSSEFGFSAPFAMLTAGARPYALLFLARLA